jgi:hypothetical protein
MTKAVLYKQGDAAAYAAWLERQTPAVGRLAAQFRPWEVYQMDDAYGDLVKVVGHQSDGTLNLLDVEFIGGAHKGRVITVVDHQIKLWGVAGLDASPNPAQD